MRQSYAAYYPHKRDHLFPKGYCFAYLRTGRCPIRNCLWQHTLPPGCVWREGRAPKGNG